MTVATNTAGRGTDIKLTAAAVSAGGLHLIFDFFPSNLRVECQGLGRSGRQGQRGTNQIFISLDEKFTQSLVQTHAVPTGGGSTEAIVESLYAARTKHVLAVSASRIRHIELERIRYTALKEFFQDQWFLHGVEMEQSDHTHLAAAAQPLSMTSSAVREAYDLLIFEGKRGVRAATVSASAVRTSS